MNPTQLKLFGMRSANCPFSDLLDPEDDHCFSGDQETEYEVLAEDHPRLPEWLADVRNVGFGDVIAKPTPIFELPTFMPTITSGSKSLLAGYSPEYVAVSLRDVISPKRLIPAKDIRQRFGVDKYTKIVLLNYAEDALIEKIWTSRRTVLSQIAGLGFDLVTSINYSIWFSQPHAERLINMKRSLITFEELQQLGVPTIPHVYWTGRTDLKRWAGWLKSNDEIWCIAVNLQTERDYRHGRWEQVLSDLQYLVSLLDRNIHFFVSGASTPERALQLKETLPKLTITNGSCSRKAACGYLMSQDQGKLKLEHSSDKPKNEIFNSNTSFYMSLLKGATKSTSTLAG